MIKLTFFLKNAKTSVGWNLNDSTTPSSKYIFSYLSKMIALHQNVANCQNTLRWRIFPQDVWMGQMCMTDAGTPQDYFILPAPPVGGLPISQDWLDRMKLVRNCSIPIILGSGKNILADTMFKTLLGTPTLEPVNSIAESDRSFMVDPLSYFSFQPVLHDWCNKGRGMCYPVWCNCGMWHIKEPLLLIGNSSPCAPSHREDNIPRPLLQQS